MKKLLGIIALFIAVQSFGQTTVVIQPTNGNDVQVQWRNPSCSNPPDVADSNSYAQSEAVVTAWTYQGCFGISRFLLRFDDITNPAVIPAGATIVSAKLALCGEDTTTNFGNSTYPGSPYNFYGSDSGWVYELAASYNPQTVTWNNQPTWKHVDSTVLPQSTVRYSQHDTMNVTNMVIDMRTNVNTGFLVKLPIEQYYRAQIFATSWHPNAARRPALIIVYDNPCSGTPAAAVISTSSPTNICSGSTQTITATDPNNASNMYYHWQQASALAGPWTYIAGATNLSYTTPALSSTTYYRLLDSCGNSHLTNVSSVFTVNVLTTPTSSVLPVSSTICAGANTSFTATATGGNITYQWRVNTGAGFNNVSNVGVYSGATTPTLSITGALASMNGYTYECIASNGCGNPAISNIAILNVNSAPAITTQPATTVTCPGNTASFSVVASGAGLTYQWLLNGSPISNGLVYSGVTTPTLGIAGATLGMNGNQYSCTVSGTCLPNATSAAATLNVSVFTATATVAGPTSFCSGGSVAINANTIPSANYQWQLNSVNINGATGTTYQAGLVGYYRVIISTPNGCNATSASVYLNVAPSPPTPSISANGPLTVCSGTHVILSFNGVSGNNYQWMQNGVAIPGANGLSYSVPSSGTYYVVASNSNNCTDSSNIDTVTINPAPAPFVITADGSTSICLGSKVTLTGNVPAGLSYQWYDNNNLIIGALGSSYDAPDSGNFTLVITDGNGCFTTSIPLHLYLDIVSPAIQKYGNILCTGIYPAYQWFFNGYAISGATAACYTPALNGKYSVSATDAIGCSGMSNYIDIEDLTGVNNVSAADFRIYPNPATSVIHIDAPVKISVTISGIEGKIISSYVNPKDIDISQLASGIYLVHVYDENQNLVHTEKLVKSSW